MIPVVCRVKHDPENGTYGDCIRACVASIMELDAEAVPHFVRDNPDGDVGIIRLREWLAPLGYSFWLSAHEGCERTELFDQIASDNPDMHYMLFGLTSMNMPHVVVCCGDRIVHDPSWTQSSVSKPTAGGFWVVGVIVKK